MAREGPAQDDGHDEDPHGDGDVLDPERQQPVPGEGPAQGESGEAGRDEGDGDQDVEVGDPAPEDRPLNITAQKMNIPRLWRIPRR